MKQRNISHHVQAALRDTPVVLLNGARQTGKSTLARDIATKLGGDYITLDDTTVLSGAMADPAGFLRGLGTMTVIDEVQKAPALFPAIKIQVDTDRRPGRYLLTGSANVLLLPKISESLAGRMEIISLWPLSQGELRDRRESFIEHVFAPELRRLSRVTPQDLDVAALVATGGYPEAITRTDESRRHDWFNSYLTAILQRDVRDLANIEGLTDMPRLLSLLAARSLLDPCANNPEALPEFAADDFSDGATVGMDVESEQAPHQGSQDSPARYWPGQSPDRPLAAAPEAGHPSIGPSAGNLRGHGVAQTAHVVNVARKDIPLPHAGGKRSGRGARRLTRSAGRHRNQIERQCREQGLFRIGNPGRSDRQEVCARRGVV
jgi:AAA domain